MRGTRLLPTILIAVLAAPASAQELPIYELGEVVASARRPVGEQAVTQRIVTAEEIEAAGARTLDEALALLPGVDLRTGGAGVPRINVRGFRSRHLVVLLDGIPLNSTFDGQVDPSFIAVENIAFIKFLPATGSVLYGQGGLAGVINIVTRRGAARLSGVGTGEVREGPARAARVAVGGEAGPIAYFASGSVLDSDGYPSVSVPPSLGEGAPARRMNSHRERRNVFANLVAAPSERSSVGLVVSRTEGAYGIPPGLIDDPSDPFANRPTYERVEDLAGTSAQLAASYDPAGPFDLRGWAFTNRWDEDRARYDNASFTMDDPTVRGSFREASRSSLSGVGLQAALGASSASRLILALSAERDEWESDLHIRDVPVGGGGGGGGGGSGGGGGGSGGGGGGGGGGGSATYEFRDMHDRRTLARYGVALEYELRPMERVGVTLGAARHWLDREEQDLLGATAFAAGVHYAPAAGTTLRASAARKFRFPTVRQLYDPDGGNPELRAEFADVFEAGIEQAATDRARVGLTLFHTVAKDYIERPDRGEAFANHDEYLFRGAEATVAVRPIEALRLETTYTYLDTEDRSPGASREELQYRPKHRATFVGRFAPRVGPSATLSVLHVAGQVYYSRREPIERAELPAYTVVSARLSQRLFGGRAEVFAGADNLFDVAYEEEYGSPQATRVLYAGLTVRW